MGVLLEDHVEDQPAGRLVDRQRHAGQPGRPGGPQRHDPVLGPGQDVPVEDPGRIPRDRLGPQAAAGDDQLARPSGRAADDVLGDAQLHAAELAVEGRDRGDPLEFPSQEGGAGAGTKPAGDVEHDLDEVAQGELTLVLALGDLPEELVEGSAVDDPVQSDAGHHRSRSPFDERVEDGGQDHSASLVDGSYPRSPRKLRWNLSARSQG
jgi:hypothetical protein